MKVIYLFLFLCLPLVSKAECVVDGAALSINESIFIKDPELVKKSYEFYLSKGSSKKEAAMLADTSDFVGYLLVCREIFEVKNGQLVSSGRALVLNDLFAEVREKRQKQ